MPRVYEMRENLFRMRHRKIEIRAVGITRKDGKMRLRIINMYRITVCDNFSNVEKMSTVCNRSSTGKNLDARGDEEDNYDSIVSLNVFQKHPCPDGWNLSTTLRAITRCTAIFHCGKSIGAIITIRTFYAILYTLYTTVITRYRWYTLRRFIYFYFYFL